MSMKIKKVNKYAILLGVILFACNTSFANTVIDKTGDISKFMNTTSCSSVINNKQIASVTQTTKQEVKPVPKEIDLNVNPTCIDTNLLDSASNNSVILNRFIKDEYSKKKSKTVTGYASNIDKNDKNNIKKANKDYKNKLKEQKKAEKERLKQAKKQAQLEKKAKAKAEKEKLKQEKINEKLAKKQKKEELKQAKIDAKKEAKAEKLEQKALKAEEKKQLEKGRENIIAHANQNVEQAKAENFTNDIDKPTKKVLKSEKKQAKYNKKLAKKEAKTEKKVRKRLEKQARKEQKLQEKIARKQEQLELKEEKKQDKLELKTTSKKTKRN